MVVCRFFLQGNCKFGNNCWNEHIDENPKHRFGLDHFKKYHYETETSNTPRYTNPHLPFYVQPKNVGFSFNQALSNIDPNSKFEVIYEPTKATNSLYREFQSEELKSVKEDVIAWSQGNMWPFTCYSPRNRNCLSCFKDISPEELRWGMAEAEHNGTLQSYLQTVNETLAQINSRREELRNPTSQLLKSLNNDELNTSPVNFQNTQSVLAQTSFKLPDNNFVAFSSSMNGSSTSSKFSLSNLSGQKSSQQVAHANNNQQNIFNNGNSAKSFSFTLAAAETETEMNAFPSYVSSQVTLLNNLNMKSEHAFGEKSASSKDKYSELNHLSKMEKEQFMAPKFVLGMIPTKPPPIVLCF